MHQLYKIKLSPSIAPSWSNGEFNLPVLSGLQQGTIPADAEVLATYSTDSINDAPLIIKKNGEVSFLFDINETTSILKEERYPGAELAFPITSRLPFDYTKFPMWFIGLMSRVLTGKADLSTLPPFPQYPMDFSADILDSISGQKQVTWPEGKKYAVVFTHDVDTEWLFKNDDWLKRYKDCEERSGIRSAWYTVPLAIKAAKTKQWLKTMHSDGHEIGAHGYDHNATLPNLPMPKLQKQLSSSFDIISSLIQSDEIGYRAPWLTRNKNLCIALQKAGYLYDTSFPTSDFQRNNPVANNGVCTVFPFVREGLPILPVSVPQDVMYISLAKAPLDFYKWINELTKEVKKTGGVAVISTHLQPHHSANEPMLEGYKYITETLGADKDAWHTTPRELIKHYKQRS